MFVTSFQVRIRGHTCAQVVLSPLVPSCSVFKHCQTLLSTKDVKQDLDFKMACMEPSFSPILKIRLNVKTGLLLMSLLLLVVTL